MFFNIYREDTDHLPWQEMDEIDLMSRMTDDETFDSERKFWLIEGVPLVLWYICLHAPYLSHNVYSRWDVNAVQ